MHSGVPSARTGSMVQAVTSQPMAATCSAGTEASLSTCGTAVSNTSR